MNKLNMEDNNSILRQYGAKYGLILGVALLIISIASICFVANVDLSPVGLVFSQFFSAVILKLALAIAAVLWLRKAIGGYWNLKQATTGIFFMFYMAFLINYIGYDITFTHVVAPATMQRAGERTITAYQEAQRGIKAPQKETDKKISQMRDALRKGYIITPMSVLSYLISWVLIIFLISFIFAALFKREPPLFTRNADYE